MNNLPLNILISMVLIYCIFGMSISNGPSLPVAGRDILHWLEYDGGYDYYGRLDRNMNIEYITQTPSNGNVENMLKDAAVCDINTKTLRRPEDMADNEKIYFAAMEAGEDAPGKYGCYCVFFFDDFTSATDNASDYINDFDINKPDEWVLSDYKYVVENPQEVEQFFTDRGLIQ